MCDCHRRLRRCCCQWWRPHRQQQRVHEVFDSFKLLFSGCFFFSHWVHLPHWYCSRCWWKEKRPRIQSLIWHFCCFGEHWKSPSWIICDKISLESFRFTNIDCLHLCSGGRQKPRDLYVFFRTTRFVWLSAGPTHTHTHYLVISKYYFFAYSSGNQAPPKSIDTRLRNCEINVDFVTNRM